MIIDTKAIREVALVTSDDERMQFKPSSVIALLDRLEAAEKALTEPAAREHKPTGWMAHKNQYVVPVLFNPYTGEPRDVRDVQSDPQGVLIVPPGKVEMIAASPPPPAEVPLLTDAEIMRVAVKSGDFARNIEQATRIKFGMEFVK